MVGAARTVRAAGAIAGTAVASIALIALVSGCDVRTPMERVESLPASRVPVEVTSIELPYRGVVVPQKVGSALYFSASGEQDAGDNLLRYDIETKQADVVFEAPGVIGSVDANNRWLLWESELKLYAQSLETGERNVIASSRDLYAPALEEDRVAWIDLTPERKHEVVVHDLTTGKRRVIAPISFPGLYNNFMEWDEGRLVWTDIIEGRGSYRIFDATTGRITDYDLNGTNYRYPGYSKPSGDRVYSVNFKQTDEWDWTVQQLGYFSLKDKKWTPIVPEGFIANHFCVWNDCLAIIDSEMRLTLRRQVDASAGNAGQSIVKTTADSVTSSDDGTLVITHDEPQGEGVTVYLVKQR